MGPRGSALAHRTVVKPGPSRHSQPSWREGPCSLLNRVEPSKGPGGRWQPRLGSRWTGGPNPETTTAPPPLYTHQPALSCKLISPARAGYDFLCFLAQLLDRPSDGYMEGLASQDPHPTCNLPVLGPRPKSSLARCV